MIISGAHRLSGAMHIMRVASAWVSKFSGIPSQSTLPLADLYSSIPPNASLSWGANPAGRSWDDGSTNAPVCYETLASVSADAAEVLRLSLTPYNVEYLPMGMSEDVGIGACLYEAARDDLSTCLVRCSMNAPPGRIDYDAYAIESNVKSAVANVADGTAGSPTTDLSAVRLRIYWNPKGAAFVIKDAGFGLYSIPATTQSWWYSKDAETTWTRIGDRTITGVVPTRFGAWLYISRAMAAPGPTARFSSVALDQWV